MPLNFDLTKIPFSKAGSWFSILAYPRDNGITELLLRTIHGDIPRREIFRVEATHNGQPVSPSIECSETQLSLKTENGSIDICLYKEDTVCFSGHGLGLRLTFVWPGGYDESFGIEERTWLVNSSTHRRKFAILPIRGSFAADTPWHGVHWNRPSDLQYVFDISPDNADGFELVVREFERSFERIQPPSFAAAHAAAQKEFAEFFGQAPAPALSALGAKTASARYITWSAIVGAAGHLRRPAMLMSKNHMTSVWSWDHCFNFMALARVQPDVAWDQLMLFFDVQDARGCLPDKINDFSISWSYVKPPIHGWALNWALDRSPAISANHLREIYSPLTKWTQWWFVAQDTNGNGIPQYHDGNDSGWDNATCFCEGVPVESPDLCAFLVLQMEALGRIAELIGKKAESRAWLERAEALVRKMIEHLWRDNMFQLFLQRENRYIKSDSLMHYMPIVLGNRLPADIFRKLVDGISSPEFLTAHGLATEKTGSDRYDARGYWRGPVWAPVIMLVVDALKQSGEIELSRTIARRFCNSVDCRMPENYDAQTGEPLCDSAYTWTSSVFLMLAQEYI